MELTLVGTVKIDSRWRKKLFVHNLIALEPISSLLGWELNIVGKYANFARSEIMKTNNHVSITIDDDSSTYQLVKTQISALNNQDPEPLLFFWMEDHWFLCPNANLFLYLLDEFKQSEAEILAVTHLVTSWQRKHVHEVVTDKYLYKNYLVDLTSQRGLWKRWPKAYLTGIPSIYKKGIATEILETNKLILENSKKPNGYELHGEKAVEFLMKRSFVEMIPTFHIFREVFKSSKYDRAICMREALQILKLRHKGNL